MGANLARPNTAAKCYIGPIACSHGHASCTTFCDAAYVHATVCMCSPFVAAAELCLVHPSLAAASHTDFRFSLHLAVNIDTNVATGAHGGSSSSRRSRSFNCDRLEMHQRIQHLANVWTMQRLCPSCELCNVRVTGNRPGIVTGVAMGTAVHHGI